MTNSVSAYEIETLRRYARIGKGFIELWRLGAPWPVHRDITMYPEPPEIDPDAVIDALVA